MKIIIFADDFDTVKTDKQLNTMDKGEIILYQPDENIRLEVRMEGETVWLTQQQMALLFGCTTDNIGLHLKNIFEEEEVDKDATTEEISVVRQEGNRQVTRKILHYNLDAILSVGYRVSSRNATRFRQWFLLFHFTKL